ncbi:MAG TPA: hypothetical protein VFN22_07480 [Gemmatimonadales bacterium]|nr:hypothetical protein [Gemmatimonadales bacterium]
MRVEQVTIEEGNGTARLTGHIAGHPLFWQVTGSGAFEPRGEPFVAALLPAAMRSGTAIVLPPELPVDPVFLANMVRLQSIFSRWFLGVAPVRIQARPAPRHVPTVERATGYSGGVDSSYTVDALARELDAALLIDGIEYPSRDEELAARVTNALESALSGRGVRLVQVVTNVKAAQRALGAFWAEAIGGAIASAVHVAGFSSYQIAASNSWENLRPYGSHPLTDPLWSSADVRIGHHGAELRRIDKIRHLGSVPDLLEHIRVCFQGNAYNCGVCQKCLQTAAGFRALGMRSSSLSHLEDARLLRRATVEHDGDLVDWQEILLPGLERHDPELYRELLALTRRYHWRTLLRDADRVLTGGRFRSMLRRRSTREPATVMSKEPPSVGHSLHVSNG